jgi:acyl-coenzyme A synthetase/AMP-(fatty) acid ligase
VTYRYDPSAYQDVFAQTFTFFGGFERNVSRYADRPALIDPASGREWSYAQLGADVERLAAGLAARGVRSRDVVVFQLFNGPGFALCYLAAQRLGAIATPINFRFSPGETAHVLDDSRPRVFAFDAELSAGSREALSMAAHRPELLISVDESGVGVSDLDGALEFAALMDDSALPAAPRPSDVTAWDETTRLYTSGTTGMPKGVSLPSAAEVLTAHDVIMHFPLSPEDRTLNMTPWFHRGGISPGGPNAAYYAGAATVTMRGFDPDRCLDLVEQTGVTYLIGAPTNLELLARAQEERPRDLRTLHGLVTMGAPLERAACLRYQEVLTPRIFNGYGTTEAFWNTFLRPADLPEHAGSAGRACTDDDVAIVRVYEDRPAEPDELVARDGRDVGEIIMRSVKSGYAYVNVTDGREQRFRQGWLYSGDLGTWDEQGYITVVGRKDDMIISGGENVHPVQVEEVLNSHPGIADSIVVGLPDPRWGEVVVAYVVPQGPGVTPEEADKHCLASPLLADFKRPRLYRLVDSLPRTATGKKMHYVIRDDAVRANAAGELVRPASNK